MFIKGSVWMNTSVPSSIEQTFVYSPMALDWAWFAKQLLDNVISSVQEQAMKKFMSYLLVQTVICYKFITWWISCESWRNWIISWNFCCISSCIWNVRRHFFYDATCNLKGAIFYESTLSRKMNETKVLDIWNST